MDKFTRILLLVLLTAWVGFSLLLGGCSKNAVSPASGNSDIYGSLNWAPPPSDLANIDHFLPPGYHVMRSPASSGMQVERVLYREKRLYRHHNGEQRIRRGGYGAYFPEGSVPYNFTAEMYVPDNHEPVVDFLPHGTFFRSNIRVVIPFDSVGLNDGDVVSIFYWNGETQCYEAMPGTVDTENHRVIAYTDHFSRYLIAKIETGVVTNG